jgi:quinone-modifying oxidoreductase subunit QmoB
MTKGEVMKVSKNGDGLIVEADNTLLGEKLQVKADLVVLGAGMVPVTKDDPVVNLAYRQGPASGTSACSTAMSIPTLSAFPTKPSAPASMPPAASGAAMTMEEAIEDASGAALKAIQCLESVNRGVSVHPRSGDMTFPDFFFQRCTQCKRCTEECPFGALDDDEKGTPKPNPTRCRRCGTCMGACPERIIGFADYNIDSIGSMVKSIGVPSEDDYTNRPAHSGPGLRKRRLSGPGHGRPQPARLLGGRALIPGPLPGLGERDLDQGRPLPGYGRRLSAGLQARRRLPVPFRQGQRAGRHPHEEDRRRPASLALENERVAQFEVAIDEYDKVPQIINDFVESMVEDLGPNPFKGF